MNKANIKPIPAETFMIGTNDVISYLQNELGFNVVYDFTRWVGVDYAYNYVRMRVAIAPDDIVAETAAKDYAERTIHKFGAGLKFKDRVINTLKPFMYPENTANIRNFPEDLERLYKYGLFGDRLQEVIDFSKLTYCREANLFRLYLRPERIIVDMLSDPTTGKVDGSLAIVAVHGTTPETIRWEVVITKTQNGNSFDGRNISIDKIFASRNN